MTLYPIAKIKSILLSGGTISLSDDIKRDNIVFCDNHHHNSWVFFKLAESSRVRLTVSDDSPAFTLVYDNGNLSIIDTLTGQKVTDILAIEKAIIHAPEQLFLGLYEYCKVGCSFCPCSVIDKKIHYSLDWIYSDIDAAKSEHYTSIGITSSVPPHLSADDVADEMIL